jgi:iron complex outermembrane receptor protein
LASPTGNFLDYVAGAYYSRAESERTFTRNVIACSASTLPAIATGLTPCSTTAGASTFTNPIGSATFGSTFKNMSLFGQATANVTDAIRLIGGLRYTNDDLSVLHRILRIPVRAFVQTSRSAERRINRTSRVRLASSSM